MTLVCLIGAGGQLAEGISHALMVRGHRVIHYRPRPVAIAGVPPRPARPLARIVGHAVVAEAFARQDGGAGRHCFVDRWEAARADVFVYCLPSYLAEYVGLHLREALRGKTVINLSDRFMGTDAMFAAARHLDPSWHAVGVALNSPPLLAYQRRRNAETSLIYSKPFVLAAHVNGDRLAGSATAGLLNDLLGVSNVRWLPTSRALAFENINSIVHAVQDLECLRSGLFTEPGVLYDRDCYTAAMVSRVNIVTQERDAIAALYSTFHYRTLAEFDGSTFVYSTTETPGTPGYRHQHPLLSTVPRPSPLSAHGYEDVGWSMVPLEALARRHGIGTPGLTALIDDWNALMSTNYRVVGRQPGAASQSHDLY